MATQGLSKHLPKRASKDHRSHITRQKSRNAREAQRLVNKEQQAKREQINAARGFTGKQLDNAYRKFAKKHFIDYRSILKCPENDAMISLEMGLV